MGKASKECREDKRGVEERWREKNMQTKELKRETGCEKDRETDRLIKYIDTD